MFSSVLAEVGTMTNDYPQFKKYNKFVRMNET
jgi:hypothetical protein